MNCYSYSNVIYCISTVWYLLIYNLLLKFHVINITFLKFKRRRDFNIHCSGPDKYFFRPLAHGKGILKLHLPWLILDKWPREKPLAQGQKSLVTGVEQVDLSYNVVV